MDTLFWQECAGSLEGAAVQQSALELCTQLVLAFTDEAMEAAEDTGSALKQLRSLATSQNLPLLFAPVRVAALGRWTPGLYLLAKV